MFTRLFPVDLRGRSEIFTCLFHFDPLVSPLTFTLPGFSPNAAERFPTNN
ncbi:MAG: hypothetical protein OJF47_001124 [Nitrospira sp.]|nr:MAG: hypothetical protein OJF47_001124 [Nitrospira sp.]